MNMATIEEAVVYVVDDDTTHLSMMHFMLRRIGFKNVKMFSEGIPPGRAAWIEPSGHG
jgi:FixJ family two-component response regulator